MHLLTYRPPEGGAASPARAETIVPPPAREIPDAIYGKPQEVLDLALTPRHFEWTAAIRAATMIREPSYDLRSFLTDVKAAFLELALYMCQRQAAAEAASPTSNGPTLSSGVTSADEYKRTVGALFAVYWLMRIGIDGERGFSMGVDDTWTPRPVPTAAEVAADASGDMKKRLAFYENQDWPILQQLFVDAGLLERKQNGRVVSHVGRTLAMLALTAFHDIMKVEALLPAVAPEHAPFQGFKAGDIINDHDIALGYVLTHYGSALPSFDALPLSIQRAVRFTQSKIAFNHGWLVQAEAPPKALFGQFKAVIKSGGAADCDIAFYFVHWLTDLAGAIPSPLAGSEKFVLKFPHPVLGSFIRSFGVINQLADASETAVFEKYLVQAWREIPQSEVGPVPTGDTAIALMRLVLQAQTSDKQHAIVDAFANLPEDDRRVLGDEMARTGADGQDYLRSPGVSQAYGPAILVYYSPAFVRSLTPSTAFEALRLLAEVYRRSRWLWPLGALAPPIKPATSPSPEDVIPASPPALSGAPAALTGFHTPTSSPASRGGAASHVTIRIDQIKDQTLQGIQQVYATGDKWLLRKLNDLEGVVERHTRESLAELHTSGQILTELEFPGPE